MIQKPYFQNRKINGQMIISQGGLLMARQAYQEQLLKLNGELIEMGDLCEEAMSLVMKALREKDEEIAVSVHKIEQKIDQKKGISKPCV